MDGQVADLIYREVLGKLETMRASGLPSTMALAEAWEPALRSHRALGGVTGSPCGGCGQPWPCTMFLNIAEDLP